MPERIELPQANAPDLPVFYDFDPDTMTIGLHVGEAALRDLPSQNDGGTLKWTCSSEPSLPAAALPSSCQSQAPIR